MEAKTVREYIDNNPELKAKQEAMLKEFTSEEYDPDKDEINKEYELLKQI